MQYRSDMTVQLVDFNATDEAVTRAARVSTLGSEAEKEWSEDRDKGLIGYLIRNRHGSPFEHNSFTFYIEAPIFVWREFMRHRIGVSYNEESGRYKELAPVFYVPNDDRPLVQIGKPGAYTFTEGSPELHHSVREGLTLTSRISYEVYQTLLEAGVAREVARMALPLNIYSSAYVTMNARSIMSFLSLRTRHPDSKFPSTPQAEIEMVAEQIEHIFRDKMPVTHAAFVKAGRVSP